MADWDSNQYLRFANERTQPAIDLVNRVNTERPEKILDIGCGPGNSTAILKWKFPDAYILGIDNSTNMIETARTRHPDLEFKLCDANTELTALAADYDLVFSNACIQWLPDHHRLLPAIMGLLRKGGILAVQTPMNYEEPIHRIIGEITESARWKPYFKNPRIFYNLTDCAYYDLLADISASFDIWKTTYYHKLKSHGDILEWYRGTGLRPYLNVLSESDKGKFEGEVLRRVIESYPMQKGGGIIFRFPRFFFTAVK